MRLLMQTLRWLLGALRKISGEDSPMSPLVLETFLKDDKVQ